MKTIAIHQPNYLPWLGYFYKISRCDVFVILDDVDFQWGNASSLTNRTRIMGPNAPFWLTVPVRHAGGPVSIRNTMINESLPWKKKHCKSLAHSYQASPHFGRFFPLVQSILDEEHASLAALNFRLIQGLCNWLEIRTPMVLSSSLEATPARKTTKITAICQALGATTYLSGSGARKYQQEDDFSLHGIELRYTDFRHPAYPQTSGDFVPGLSVLDALFQLGSDTAGLLKPLS